MIKGVGVDIVNISRIKIELARRILSEEEIKIFNSFKFNKRKIEFLGGRFSAKEAIIKAISSTKYKVGMRDITIVNDEFGKPYVSNPSYDDIKLFISISHETDACVGLCIIENR